MSFATFHAARESVREEERIERRRAAREADVLARVGPEAFHRICCRNRHSGTPCEEHEPCLVLASVLA